MLPVAQVKMLVYVSLVLIVLSTARFCRADATDGSQGDGMLSESTRHKRGPTVGLFAFPRVGRSDPSSASDLLDWGEVEQQLTEDYEDYPMRAALANIGEMAKRQGKLVAFPRVGRAGPSPLAVPNARYWPAAQAMLQKRASNSGANSGMWFGPRLGKRATVALSEIKGEQL